MAHFEILMKEFKKNARSSRKASGVEEQYTELDILLQDIKEREESEDLQRAQAKETKAATQKEKGQAIRDSAMQGLSDEGKRKRQKVQDTRDIIREKMEMEMHLRGEQLQLSREQNATMARQMGACMSMNQQYFQMMSHSMITFQTNLQDQQRQFQNNFLDLQRQNSEIQKQNSELLSLILQMQSKNNH